jgi:aldose 1-epimerase
MMDINSVEFGHTHDGKEVHLFTLTNDNGVRVSITNYGGIITSIVVPDKKGNFDDIVLGFDKLEPYLGDHPYFGAICGRYANRIANGRFTIDGHEYELAVNNGPNHLHGGIQGFDKVVWDAIANISDDGASLLLTYLSKDMDEGYPGNLFIKVYYILTNENELKIKYFAETDRKTPINLTNHSYFNLTGAKENILNHELWLNSKRITIPDNGNVPTGEYADVKGTAFDFNEMTSIGFRIAEVCPPIGYDHNYVLNKKNGELSHAATLYEAKTGRTVDAYTTEPGMQFYCSGWIDRIEGKNGRTYKKHFGVALEAQHYPDSPNKPEFPNTILKPEDTYSQLTIYKFGVKA